jgi:hypothetical protein
MCVVGAIFVQYNYDVSATQLDEPELQPQLKAECVEVSAAQVVCTSHSASNQIDSAHDQNHLCLGPFEQFW